MLKIDSIIYSVDGWRVRQMLLSFCGKEIKYSGAENKFEIKFNDEKKEIIFCFGKAKIALKNISRLENKDYLYLKSKLIRVGMIYPYIDYDNKQFLLLNIT